MIFEFVISIATIMYFGFTIFLHYHWKRIRVFESGNNSSQLIQKITVIIPVRNEAENLPFLLRDIGNQTFKFFEVIIIDDHSEDGTVEIVENLKKELPFEVKIYNLPSKRKIASHKKAAITLAISKAEGEIMVTTDGDCRVGTNWLKHIHDYFIKHNPKFVSSGVTFLPENNTFEKFQTIEFMSLIGSGAACMHAGIPNMCNGANLAYRKEVFKEVNGFEGVEHIPSGDDEFLMHKVSEKYPGKVHFLKDYQTIVKTFAKPDLSSFFQQRKRWGGKWSYYQSKSPKFVALGIFSFHFLFVLTVFAGFIGFVEIDVLLLIFLLKSLIEFAYLRTILTFYHKQNLSYLSPILSLLHPFYIVIMAFAGTLGTYKWKGREF